MQYDVDVGGFGLGGNGGVGEQLQIIREMAFDFLTATYVFSTSYAARQESW